MKKLIILLVTIALLVGSILAVKNYNNSSDNILNKNNIEKNKDTSSEKENEPQNNGKDIDQSQPNNDDIVDIENTNKDNIDENKNSDSSDTVSDENNPSKPAKIEAIDFTLEDLDGNKVSLSDFKGKNVFLNFWASWCPPCKLEMPDIEKLYQETKDSDLVILGINYGEETETVKKFIKDNNYNFKILLDPQLDVAYSYGIFSIPRSYFIDKEGNIARVKVGFMTLDEMKQYVDSLK